MTVVLNLYPINFKKENSIFTVFESETEIPPEDLNRVRYRLFRGLVRPVFRDGFSFFVLGEVKKDNVLIEMSKDKIYSLRNIGTLKVTEFKNASQVQELLRDSINLRNVYDRWRNKFMKKYNYRIVWKGLEVFIYPKIEDKVIQKEKNYYLQLDISFKFIPCKTLQELIEKSVIHPSENLEVKPSKKDFVGQIVKIGLASELSEDYIREMIKKSTTSVTRKAWEEILADAEKRKRSYVIQLKGGYTYPATVLYPVLRIESFHETERVKLLSMVKLSPQKRINFIREIISLLREYLPEWDISPEEAKSEGKIEYLRDIRDAKGLVESVDKNMRAFIQKCNPFIKKNKLRLGLLAVERNNKSKAFRKKRRMFIKNLRNAIKEKGIEIETSSAIGITANSREEAKLKLVDKFDKLKDTDILIIFFDEYGEIDHYTDLSLYDFIKSEFLKQGIPTQFIKNKTLQTANLDTMELITMNVMEQILAKTGNIPYKLANPLGKIDVFVGLDVSRINKTNQASFAKIFLSDGTFIKYQISKSPSFGEEITKRAIESLFLFLRREIMKERIKIVVHRDGRFPKGEMENFLSLSKVYKCDLELVEVVKRKNPRFFGDKMLKGHCFKLDENTLILATYNNIYRGTHNPIKIRRVYGKIPIETHASYVLSLTLLNYASFQPVKLPATIHYSDKITKLMLRGIEPFHSEGDIMYWL
ncbi:MAG: hypothetical protein DSY42_02695 [Aquifex sp.]|nr:MAG: hypothetical protein DSY42_02695 [Aquifex sp.]